MGLPAAIAALTLTAAAGGVTNYVQAREQAKSARKASASAREAAATQKRQLGDQASVEREKQIRQARAIQARALVSAAESGFSIQSGDVDALLAAIDSDAALNLDIIDQNLASNQALVDSRAQASIAEYESRTTSPLLSAFQGTLGGATTGFALIAGANALSDRAGVVGSSNPGLAPETQRMQAANSVR